MPTVSDASARETLRLEPPSLERLDGYAAALAAGWSGNNLVNTSAADLAALRSDPAGFLDRFRSGTGTVTLPDGSVVPRLPFRTRWIWDGDFCGSIGLRWQERTNALPDHVLGHIGFAVVPWKRRRGYAARALGLMLGEAREVGLTRLEITADPDNLASRRTIEANGGRLLGEFVNLRFGPEPKVRYVIDLA